MCDRRIRGLFWTTFEDTRRDKDKFCNYFLLSIDYFEELYVIVKFLYKQKTNIRISVSPKEKLKE
jgi:hypothetical protein